MSQPTFQFDDITRVEVIDGYGRTYASYNASQVTVCVQDDGKTLKIIHTGDTRHSVTPEHSQALSDQLQQQYRTPSA